MFTPVLAKHSKAFSLIDCISVGVDRMQRTFEPMRKQVEAWQKSELTDVTAKVVIYEAFVEGQLEAPKHLARTVHDLYFEPKYEEFRSRTIGVSLTHSLLRSRNWIQFRSLRPRRSSVNSWKRAFHNRSDLRGCTGRATPPESIYSEVSSVKVAGSNWHAQNSRLAGASTCHRVGRLQFAQGMIKKIVVSGPRGGRCEISSYWTKNATHTDSVHQSR